VKFLKVSSLSRQMQRYYLKTPQLLFPNPYQLYCSLNRAVDLCENNTLCNYDDVKETLK
jgi:hypothetical protein